MKHYTSPERRSFAKQQRRQPTRGEEILWSVVRAGRLDGWKFKRQVPFGTYVADFACATARLVVEVDGRTHGDPKRQLRDRQRDQGWQVLRLSDELLVGSPAVAAQAIQEALGAPSPDPR